MSAHDISLGDTTSVQITTPTGDVYGLHWDAVARCVVLYRASRGDIKGCAGALAVTPAASNSLNLRPLRRDA